MNAAMAKLVNYACVALTLTLFISSVFSQCSTRSQTQPKLRLMSQLTVKGCPVFLLDAEASDGLRLVVEPLMCVTQGLDKVLPRSDLITKQTYVSVPVTIRDDAILAEIRHEVRYSDPKSVKFADVSDIVASADASSAIEVFGFDWTPEEATGTLRLGCSSDVKTENSLGQNCSITKLLFGLRKSDSTNDINFLPVSFTIKYFDGTRFSSYPYSLVGQNSAFSDRNPVSQRYSWPACSQLQFVRSIRIGNCIVRVHQKTGDKGSLLIEPLLCHNITGFANEPVVYDYSRDMYYLKIDVLLKDYSTSEAVKIELADLSPTSVTFMRFWSAENVASPALSRRFLIGKLMVSEYSGLLRVYCRTEIDCYGLRQQMVQLGAYSLWKYVKWNATYVTDPNCELQSAVSRFLAPPPKRDNNYVTNRWRDSCNGLVASVKTSLSTCTYSLSSDDRLFVNIQQQMTAGGDFQRNWTEYENGFGDSANFWIGLSTISALSANGTTLRVEMVLQNGTQHYAEFSGFKVEDAGTNYTMTYLDIVKNMSSIEYDSLQHNKGMKFATRDVDTAGLGLSCPSNCGGGGWWYHEMKCCYVNPTGRLVGERTWGSVYWAETSNPLVLREIRLMLQIG